MKSTVNSAVKKPEDFPRLQIFNSAQPDLNGIVVLVTGISPDGDSYIGTVVAAPTRIGPRYPIGYYTDDWTMKDHFEDFYGEVTLER